MLLIHPSGNVTTALPFLLPGGNWFGLTASSAITSECKDFCAHVIASSVRNDCEAAAKNWPQHMNACVCGTISDMHKMSACVNLYICLKERRISAEQVIVLHDSIQFSVKNLASNFVHEQQLLFQNPTKDIIVVVRLI